MAVNPHFNGPAPFDNLLMIIEDDFTVNIFMSEMSAEHTQLIKTSNWCAYFRWYFDYFLIIIELPYCDICNINLTFEFCTINSNCQLINFKEESGSISDFYLIFNEIAKSWVRQFFHRYLGIWNFWRYINHVLTKAH